MEARGEGNYAAARYQIETRKLDCRSRKYTRES